jgi:ubiquinone/menaquinone biosynthesis C-methylase UbiE
MVPPGPSGRAGEAWETPWSRPAWLTRIYDDTAWYWGSFVHAQSYGRAYRKLFARLRQGGWFRQKPSQVLDCGIGAGVFSEALVRSLGPPVGLVGADLSPRLLESAMARLRARGLKLRMVRADVRRLPFRDATMDLVMCGLVLDHVGERSTALAELARVARPGAPVVVVTTRPLAPDLPVRMVFRYARLRPAAVERAMAEAGLRDIERRSLTGLARPFGIAFVGRAA